jgi:thiol:disulfide interchange protein DsbD
MTRTIRTALVTAVSLVALAEGHPVWAAEPKVRPVLMADVTAVSPGLPFKVALQLHVEQGWHIYWKNPGESGLAPQVTWHLPPGFKAGPLAFPGPQRHIERSGELTITTNTLSGSPVLTTTITPPRELAGSEVPIRADLVWLVCKDVCLRQTGTVALTLTVAGDPGDVQPADQAVFAIATATHPVPADRARHLRLEAKTVVAETAPGQLFEITLNLNVNQGFHIQSHKPTIKGIIPTDVFVAAGEGLTVASVVYPPAETRVDKLLGKVSGYHGDVPVRIRIAVADDFASPAAVVSGVLHYQACDDRTGQCFRPQYVSWDVRLPVAGATAPPAEQPDAVSPAVSDIETTIPDATGDRSAAPPSRGIIILPPVLTQSIVMRALDGEGPREGDEAKKPLTLVMAILFGMIGGLILNIMPCVLPVISIKILSFVQQAGEEPRRVFRLGLVFALGIVVSFWALAILTLLLKSAADEAVSWGTQFQHPAFIVGMSTIMFVFGLNLFGVFEIVLPGSTASRLGEAAEREGYAGAFVKGALATLLATPCTAPFLAPAVSFALASSTITILVVFTAVGVGMAMPYVLLTAKPAWMRYLPRPGNWMVTFKQFMGFLLMGTVVWLLWVLGNVGGTAAVIPTVAFLGFLALGCWLVGKIDADWSPSRRVVGWCAALGTASVGLWLCYGRWYASPPQTPGMPPAVMAATDTVPSDQADWSQGIPWIPYRPGLAEELAAAGRIVYVDYTATWCLTCLANKQLVLETDPVRNKMKALGVVPIKADFTNEDPAIAKDLRRFRRDAVPLNLVYHPAPR